MGWGGQVGLEWVAVGGRGWKWGGWGEAIARLKAGGEAGGAGWAGVRRVLYIQRGVSYLCAVECANHQVDDAQVEALLVGISALLLRDKGEDAGLTACARTGRTSFSIRRIRGTGEGTRCIHKPNLRLFLHIIKGKD